MNKFLKLILFWSAVIASIQAMADNTLEFPSNTPVKLGYGWNTTLQRPLQRICVNFKENRYDYVDVPYSKLRTVSDKNTVNIALAVNQTAEMALPIGSGSATLDFSGKISNSTDSLLVVAEARVELGPEFASPIGISIGHVERKVSLQNDQVVALSPAVADSQEISLKKKYRDIFLTDRKRFFELCGDSFVYVLHRGAVMYGVIEISHVTNEERAKLTTSVKGSVLNLDSVAKAAFSGSFSTAYEQYSQQNRTSSFFVAYGAGETIPSDQASLISALQQLPSIAKKNPRYLRFGTLSYSNLGELANAHVPAVDESPVSILTRKWIELDSLRAQLEDVTNSNDYLFSFDATLSKLKELDSDIVRDRRRIEARLKECREPGKKCNLGNLGQIDIYEYRTRMPVRGTFADFANGVDAAGLIENIAQQRWKDWIMEEHRLRCSLRPSDCKSQKELAVFHDLIVKNMYKAIGG